MFSIRSLWTKSILCVLIPTTLVLILVTLLGFYAFEQVARDAAQDMVLEITHASADRFAGELNRYIQVLQRLAAEEEVRSLQPGVLKTALENVPSGSQMFDAGIAIYDSQSMIRDSSFPPEGRESPTFPWPAQFDQIRRTLQPVFSDVFRDSRGQEVILVGVPILGDRGRFLGVLAGMARIETLKVFSHGGPPRERPGPPLDRPIPLAEERERTPEFRRGRPGPPFSMKVIDGQERVISANFPGGLLPTSELEVKLPSGGTDGVVFPRTPAGDRFIVGFTTVPGTNWRFIIQQRWDAFLPGVVMRAYLMRLLALLSVSGILSGMMISLLMGRILGPIRTLTQSARRIAEGHFDHVIVAPTGDEIEVLAQQFKGMAQALQESFTNLEQRVADRTRELSALYEVTAIASRSWDWQETLARSLERVLVAVQGTAGAIYLRDETQEGLDLAVQQGFPPGWAASLESLPLDKGLRETGKERAEAFMGPDPPFDFPDDAEPAAWGGTWVGVPMRASGGVKGLLLVFRETGHPTFTEEEMALLTSLADQVGVVVESHQLRQRAEEAAVLEERQRLARDLHDAVTQSLYSLTLLAETGRRSAQAGDAESAIRYLSRLGEVAQQALKEMRLLIYGLRPAVLQQEGLVGALQQRLEAVENRAGVETCLLVEGEETRVGPVEEALYLIAQEALNNALKHAQATAVTVRIRFADPAMEMEVADNGQGFDPDQVAESGGMGLATMRERAEKLGGTLSIHSSPGEGTTVRVADVQYKRSLEGTHRE